jgi:hypothetical protein
MGYALLNISLRKTTIRLLISIGGFFMRFGKIMPLELIIKNKINFITLRYGNIKTKTRRTDDYGL